MNTILARALDRPLTDILHGHALIAAARALARRLHAPQRLACDDPLALITALLACAIAGQPADLLPRDNGASDTLRDSSIALDPAAAASLPPLADIALTLHTSGTSGDGSAVSKTLGAMLREAAALLTLPQLPAGGTALGSVQPQHLYGLTFRIFLSLLAGWQIDRPQHRYPELLLDASHRHHAPQIWISSPTLLRALAAHDLTPWRGSGAIHTSYRRTQEPAEPDRRREQHACPLQDIN